MALATTAKTTQPPGDALMAFMLNGFCTQLTKKGKNEMKKVLAAATTAATTSGNTGEDTSAGGRGRQKARGDHTVCPHFRKTGKHKPEDCFMLPANATKNQPTSLMDS